MRTGTGAIRPFAREKPRPLPKATAPESLGVGGVGCGQSGSLFGQSVSRGVGRPPVRRPLSAGVGRGGVGGQRLHLAKSDLGPLRWPVGEGRAKASPSRPFVASGGLPDGQ